MHTTSRRRLGAAAAALVAVTVVGPLASNSGASTATHAVPVSLGGSTGTTDILNSGDELICDECIPDALSPLPGATGYGGHYAIKTKADFSAAGEVGLTLDDADLQEGATLPLDTSLDLGTGTVTVTATWSGAFGFFNDANDQDDDGDGQLEWQPVDSLLPDGSFNGSIDIVGSAPCALPAPGQAPVTCTVDLGETTFLELPILPGVVDVDYRLKLTADVEIDASGATTMRDVHVENGPSVDSGAIAWAGNAMPMTTTDQLALPCGPIGRDVLVDVGTTDYDAVVDITEKIAFNVVLDLPTPPFEDIEWEVTPLGTYAANNVPVSLSGAGGTANLGALQADSTAPELAPVVPAGGAEGQALAFQAGATDQCGAPTVKWSLSDGGKMYGDNVSHVFADNGSYTGQVTATDTRGNHTTVQFGLGVDNQAPVAKAGPDHSALWGVPVHFGGSATDPGSADLPSMAYSWSFGDGSPSAAGGPSVSHTYAGAGTYVSTFTSEDKDGASSSDTRTVTISARSTEVAYTGPISGLPKKIASFTAAITDQLGQPVAGRTVRFTLGSQVVTAKTGADGVAVAPMKLDQKPGQYTLDIEFVSTAADARYLPSADSVPFKIGK